MRLGPCSFAALLCLAGSLALGAAGFSFTGTFAQDDQLELFQFTAPSASVTLRTWSYASGTNAAGNFIAAGGFDPVLSLFNATGGLTGSSPLIASNDDGIGVAVDPVTGNGFDSLLSLTSLLAGDTYVLVLSQYDNLAFGPTYGDGFSQVGNGNFTAGEFGCGGTAPFCDSTPAQRNGNWAVDIVGVGAASDITNSSAPEPGSFLLLAAGVLGLALARTRAKHLQADV
jgi:hypothetical protein